MHRFKLNECPLCNKVLQYHLKNGENIFECPTQIQWMASSNVTISHYQVKLTNEESTQRMCVLPYIIENKRTDYKSRIYKVSPELLLDKWNLLAETTRIQASDSQDLLDKIRNIVQAVT